MDKEGFETHYHNVTGMRYWFDGECWRFNSTGLHRNVTPLPQRSAMKTGFTPIIGTKEANHDAR